MFECGLFECAEQSELIRITGFRLKLFIEIPKLHGGRPISFGIQTLVKQCLRARCEKRSN